MPGLGKYGESLAASVLTEKGYKIIEKNYHYGHGEIDIIAEDNGILVFVEVKTRKNINYGEPEEAVTRLKQQQIIKIAGAYLYEKGLIEVDCRFDVIAILIADDKVPMINHITNAF